GAAARRRSPTVWGGRPTGSPTPAPRRPPPRRGGAAAPGPAPPRSCRHGREGAGPGPAQAQVDPVVRDGAVAGGVDSADLADMGVHDALLSLRSRPTGRHRNTPENGFYSRM